MTQSELHALIAPLSIQDRRLLRDLLNESLDGTALVEAQHSNKESDYSLQGTIIHYDDPFEPVALEEWDALK